MHLSMLAPTPLLGEVGQSWGFDLIRIQLPHPPGNVRIQILTGHALRVLHAHLSDSISQPLGQACHSKQGKFPTLSRVGGWGGGLTLIGALYTLSLLFFVPCVPHPTHTTHFLFSLSFSLPLSFSPSPSPPTSLSLPLPPSLSPPLSPPLSLPPSFSFSPGDYSFEELDAIRAQKVQQRAHRFHQPNPESTGYSSGGLMETRIGAVGGKGRGEGGGGGRRRRGGQHRPC